MTSTAYQVQSIMESKYGLKKVGREYRGRSPFRNESDSGTSFVLKIDDDEHGVWHDHPAGTSGTLYDLAKHLGIETPKGRLDVVTTKRLYTGLADYAEAHGVALSVFETAKWTEGTHYCGTHKKDRPCLIYPTKNGNRYRFTDGEKPPYANDTGYKSCWYGLDLALPIARAKNLPLILCNGEASTVVAQHYGIPACAVTSGEKRIPDTLLSELKEKWQGEILLAYDCDNTGRRVAQEVKTQLEEKPVIIDLGFGDGGDLADFCKLHTSQAAEQLLKRKPVHVEVLPEPIKDLSIAIRELAKARKDSQPIDLVAMVEKAQSELDKLRQTAAPIKVISFKDIIFSSYENLNEALENGGKVKGLLSQMPGVDRIIGGFQPNRLCTIYGATSMGKSTFTVSLAGALINQSPGLIVPSESSPGGWMRKLIARNLKITSDKIEDGRLTPKELDSVKLEMKRLLQLQCAMLEKARPSTKDIDDAIKFALQEFGIQWVIIDSMSNVAAANGNIYEDTRAVSKGIQEITAKYPVSVIQTVQVGRNAKGRSNKAPLLNDAKGGGDIEEDSDIVLSIYNHHYYVQEGSAEEDPTQPEGTSMLTCLKHRWRPSRYKAIQLTLVGGSGFFEMAKVQERVG